MAASRFTLPFQYSIRVQNRVVRRFSTVEVTESVENSSNAASPSSLTKKLNVMIADRGLFSRREAESLIYQRRVTVNGAVISNPTQTFSSADRHFIEIDDVPLYQKYSTSWPRLWVVNKLREEIMAEKDTLKQRPLFYDRIKKNILPQIWKDHKGLLPVYRLDYHVEGMVILTNSGEVARLLAIQHALPVHYKVRVHGLITDSKLQGLRKGLFSRENTLRYPPLEIRKLPSSGNTNAWLSISTNAGSGQPKKENHPPPASHNSGSSSSSSSPSSADSRSHSHHPTSNIVLQYNKPHLIKEVLKAVHLQPTRMICVGFGPFQIEDIIKPSTSATTSSTTSTRKRDNNRVKEEDDNSNSNGLIMKEVKLPKELHASCLRLMNHKYSNNQR